MNKQLLRRLIAGAVILAVAIPSAQLPAVPARYGAGLYADRLIWLVARPAAQPLHAPALE